MLHFLINELKEKYDFFDDGNYEKFIELYNELKRQIKSLQEKLHAINTNQNKLIYKLNKYKSKYGNAV